VHCVCGTHVVGMCCVRLDVYVCDMCVVCGGVPGHVWGVCVVCVTGR
jgi:hypothetical protein